MKILVVDDESSIRNLIRMQLEMEGYEVLTAADGKEALQRWDEQPDVLILDVMLPDTDGYELLRLFREKDRDIPVLMLTAKSQMNDKLLGLQLGADDYVTKPFNYAELILRVKNMARRTTKKETLQRYEMIRAGELVIYPKERKVHVNGEEIDLTYREFNLCQLFASHPHRVWVIAFASSLTSDLTYCASSNSSFLATNATQLNSAFQEIAKNVGELRVYQ